jgi:hypothetical protein
MLRNAEESWVRERLRMVRGSMPEAAPLIDELERDPDQFLVRPDGEGVEFAALKAVEGRVNRSRIKLFTVPDGPMKGRRAIFFYKASQVPFSIDRLSYGVCMVPVNGPANRDVGDWLHFASSGFDPAARPDNLRQAFAFTVPDSVQEKS